MDKAQLRVLQALEVVAMRICAYPRGVHVRPYIRFRFGKLEHVCEHCRSYPGQMNLFN